MRPLNQAEARRASPERLEIHWRCWPKHGSWLDMAGEIEIGVMSRQCLDRRIPDQRTLRREAAAWQDRLQSRGHKSRLAALPPQTLA